MIVAEHDEKKQLDGLIRLARGELHGDAALSADAGFVRLAARMEGKGRSAPRKALWRGALTAVTAIAAVAALALSVGRSDDLTFAIAGGVASKDGRIIGGSATKIRFSDGSEAALERGAEARVEKLTEHGGRVVLDRGAMRVKIAKAPQASWTVAAGPYDVRVTGTAFDVSWSSEAQAFDLRMQSGAVVVTGPLAFAGIPLRAGQRMFGGVAEGRLTVEGTGSPISPPLAPSAREPTKGPAASAQSSAASASAALPVPRAGSETHTWARQVAQGNFKAVLEEAEQRGLDRTLSSASLEELVALADAARYAGRPHVARSVLLAERKRFPSSASARDAAFFLGRIAEDSGGGAIEWYERYVAESPRGSYASQAFGRKMMLLYKQRGASAAKPVADEYLSRYPKGPYAAAARKITEEFSSAAKP